jgi:hypothetical protein
LASNNCPAGTFSSSLGASVCQFCPAGTFNLLSGQLNASACVGCAVGSFCPQGSASECPCPERHYCPTAANGSLCSAGRFYSHYSSSDPCPAGFVCPAGTQTPLPCPAGIYCP